MTGHNSNRIWALSLPKLRQVENECREANTSKARQFKTCGQHRDIRHGTASGRQICCKAQLVLQCSASRKRCQVASTSVCMLAEGSGSSRTPRSSSDRKGSEPDVSLTAICATCTQLFLAGVRLRSCWLNTRPLTVTKVPIGDAAWIGCQRL